MEELMSVMTSVGTLVAAVAGGMSVIAFGYAGLLWMTAAGDPGKMGQARGALIGAVAGLIIVGVGFIVPRVISQVVLEPVGGVAITTDTGFDCDTVLRQQLVFQRAASNQDRINQVIARIQAQNNDTCSADVWNPKSDDTSYVSAANTTSSDSFTPTANEAGCWLTDAGAETFASTPANSANDATGVDVKVGSTTVPASLRNANTVDGTVRNSSGRDSQNNIIIYWAGTSAERPADNARCWLYVRSLRVWDETY